MMVGIIGLGKMGRNISRHLQEHEYNVVGYDKESSVVESLGQGRFMPAYSLESLAEKLRPRRTVILSIPAGPESDAVDVTLENLVPHLYKDDIVIDGCNSNFEITKERHARLKKHGIYLLDAGFSGGPYGARMGMAIMVGGDRGAFNYSRRLFRDLSWNHEGYSYLGSSGAGHFAKMVHNAIEYGMMQAIAEGFDILKKSEYDFDLAEVAKLYRNGSVIQSGLVNWLKQAFEQYGQDLKEVSGKVGHSGECEWAVETARKLGVHAPVIQAALQFRLDSQKNPSYTGKILSGMRNEFGGHDVQNRD